MGGRPPIGVVNGRSTTNKIVGDDYNHPRFALGVPILARSSYGVVVAFPEGVGSGCSHSYEVCYS